MKRAALYMRMSTDKQDNSIPAQRNVLTDFAAKNGFKIFTEYKDEGISGRKAEKRPGFLQMIDDSQNGDFDYVLIYDSSRFARNLEESLVYKSALKKNGVQIISATEPTLDEDTGLITDALLGAMNELYSRKLSKQVLRGMTETAKKGYCQTKPPFGYRATHESGVFVPDETNAPILRELFRMYATGTPSLSEITRWLNVTFDKRFTVRNLTSILKSQFYIGNVTWNGITVKGIHEPLIDSETFEAVQNRYSAVSFKRDPSSYKHWLSGLVKCGYCGKSMVFNNSRWSTFACNKKSIGLCSQNNKVRAYKIEDVVMDTVNRLYNGTEPITLDRVVITTPPTDDNDKILAAIKRLEAKISRAKQLFLEGVDTLEEFRQTKSALSNDIAALREKLSDPIEQDINSLKQIYKSRAAAILKAFESDDLIIQCELIRAVVNRVEYTCAGEKAIIFLAY